MLRYKDQLLEKKQTYAEALIEKRNAIYNSLYEFYILTQKGFIGKPKSKNDIANKKMWSWSKKLLEKEFDFVKFMQNIKNLGIE